MSMHAYRAQGYAPMPVRDGQPVVGGWANSVGYQYRPTDDARFVGYDVGIITGAQPLTGGVSLASVARTWVVAVQFESHVRKLCEALDSIVTRVGGDGPMRLDGNAVTRVFRVDESPPFPPRRLPPYYLPNDAHTTAIYRPHSLRVISRAGWFQASGGVWRGGDLITVKRDDLPALDAAGAERIITEAKRLFESQGALPWVY